MPKKFLMNWQPDKNRWRKMFKGKWYFVTPRELNCHQTKEASWKKANQWWQNKLSSLSAPSLDPASTVLLQALESRGSVREGIAYLNAIHEQGKAAGIVLKLLTLDDELAVPDDSDVVPNALSAAERLADGESINKQVVRYAVNYGTFEAPTEEKTVAKLKNITARLASDPPVEQERSVGYHFDQWQAFQLSSSKSASRKKMNIHMLKFFKDFMGNVDVDQINEACLLAYYNYLICERDWEGSYKKRVFSIAIKFIHYLYELRLIELPRNLKSDIFSFEEQNDPIVVVPDEDLRVFYQAATGQTKLHILLMLNCGMAAKDINDLRDTEVDWQNGTITRKRSKTRHQKNAPQVTYYLWNETFNLLKYFRSNQEYVLLTQTGRRWITTSISENQYVHSNSISSNFKWLSQKTGIKITPQNLRVKGGSKLAEHSSYKFYGQYFLAQAPNTVANAHYIKPSDAEFRESLLWLRNALNLDG